MKTPEELADEYLTKHFNDEQTAACVFMFAPIYREVFLAGYQAAKDQLADVSKVMNSSNNSNGWISVKERLPETEREVLICTQRKFIYMARIFEDGEAWPVSNGCGCCGKQEYFTHWMPLPETPKEEG